MTECCFLAPRQRLRKLNSSHARRQYPAMLPVSCSIPLSAIRPEWHFRFRRRIGGYVQWEELYAACVFETDIGRLEKLVFDTEDAIFLRFQELACNGLSNEVQELKRAASGLLEFKIKKLGWPDPMKFTPRR